MVYRALRTSEIERHLEEMVVVRNSKEFQIALTRYGTRNDLKHCEVRIKIADWYRRLGMYAKAIGVLKPVSESEIEADSLSGHEAALYSRLLNLLGASKYSLAALKRLRGRVSDPELLRAMGFVHLTNYDFASAVDCFLVAKKQGAGAKWSIHESSLLEIAIADAEAGLGHLDRAIEKAEKIVQSAGKSELLKFIALSAWGEYLVRANRFSEAAKILQVGIQYVKVTDSSNDIGFFYKWLGIATNSEAYLKKAFSLLYRPGAKPEAWLEVLGSFKDVSAQNYLRCLSYPGVRIPKFIDGWKTLSSPFLMLSDGQVTPCGRPSLNHISRPRMDMHSGLFIKKNKKKSTYSPVLSTFEDQLLGFLLRAFDYGVPKYRVIEELWPDQQFNILFLEGRLKQLVFRLRKRKIGIEMSHHHLRLLPKEGLPEVIYSWLTPVLAGAFLYDAAGEGFTRLQAEKSLGISKPSANRLIHRWSQLGLVAKPNSKFSPYQVIP